MLNLTQAQTILSETLKKAREKNMKPLSVAVLDARGCLVAYAMEDGGLLREVVAKGKAYGALGMGRSSRAIEQLAKAGVSTQDILDGGLTGSLNLAAAGSIDVGEAAETAASAMTQFGLSGSDVTHVADLLAAGAGKAQGGVTDLAYALKYAGVPAHALGVSIEETTGVLAEFASAGILGEQAGTTLRSMLLSLSAPTTRAKSLMEDYGISLYDAQGRFVGLEAAAGQLQSQLGGLTEAERNHVLSVIFGKNAIQGAITLYNGGAQAVADWTAKVNDSGFAAETAAINMDNLKGDLEQLKGSLETAFIGGGSGSQGMLRGLVQGLTGVVNAFNKMPPSAQGATTAVLGVTAALGGGLWAASKTVQGIANAKQALSDLGIEAGKAKGAIRGVAAAGAALATVVVTADLLQGAFEKLANTRFKGGSLTRDIEALANGETTKNFEKLFHTFQDINDGWQVKANPISWISSWDPSGFETAQQNIQDLDESLASLVEGGQADTAAAAFEQLALKAKEAGVSTGDFQKLFPEYATALDNVSSATNAATESNKRFAAQQQKSAKATEAAQKAAKATADSFITLGDSLSDAKVSLGDWIKDMQKQADALRNFRVNAQKAAKQGLDEGLIKSLQEAGPEGALRMRQLANATDSEIKRANKAWRSGQAEIRKYVDATDDVPGDVSTRLTLKGMAEAMSGIAHFQRELNSIDRNIDVFIRAHTTRLPSAGGMGPQVGYAGGGYTGDMSATSIAGVVHGREFVFDAETTAANRALFEAIHAGYGASVSTAVTAGALGSDGTSVAMLSRIVNRLERVESAVEAAAVATGEVVGAKVNGAANSGYGRAYG